MVELDEYFTQDPLDKLPFEILELIFNYLESSDLKSLLNIIGRTRDVVVASPIAMRKLKLHLTEDWILKVPFVKKYGGCVKSLKFEYCDFDSAEQFRDLLKFMHNIETIKMSNVHINAENLNNKNCKRFPMDFERTQKLDFDNSQAVGKLISLYLEHIQVYNMRLDFSHFNANDVFSRLLCFQDYLTTLELSGFENMVYQSLFKHDISYMITFELRKLILNHRVTKNEIFLKFIQTLNKLEELEVYKEVEYQEFLNEIFEMKSLRSLTLATHFTTLKNIDFKKSNKSDLEELILVTGGQYGIDQTINYLVEKLHKLKTLKVINSKTTDSSDQIFAFVHLKALEILYVENSKLKFFQNIKFNNLKSVTLKSIHPFLKFEDWQNFFKNNQHIEQLIINDFEVYCVAESIKIEVEKVIKNLHHLSKSLKYFELNQDMRYQKPIKVVMKISEKAKLLRVSDSFIKICREEFHLLRKSYNNLHLQYYADDYFRLNNKYLL